MISDRGPYFAVELIKELNRMLEIKTRLLIAFLSELRIVDFIYFNFILNLI